MCCTTVVTWWLFDGSTAFLLLACLVEVHCDHLTNQSVPVAVRKKIRVWCMPSLFQIHSFYVQMNPAGRINISQGPNLMMFMRPVVSYCPFQCGTSVALHAGAGALDFKNVLCIQCHNG